MATIPARLSKAFLSDTFSDLVYPSFLKVVEAGSLYYFFEYRTSQMEQRVEDKLERLGIRLNAETVESSVSKRLDSFTHDLYEVLEFDIPPSGASSPPISDNFHQITEPVQEMKSTQVILSSKVYNTNTHCSFSPNLAMLKFAATILSKAWNYRSPTYLRTLKVIQCWGPPLVYIRADRELARGVRNLRAELDEITMADAQQLLNDCSKDNSRWLIDRQYLLFE